MAIPFEELGDPMGRPVLMERRPTMTASKRIPVTEDRWRDLSELKSAGETYDELLEKLIREHRRKKLAERAAAVRQADSEELTSLDDLSNPSERGR